MDGIDVQIAQRGIVTIPKAMRDTYGLEPGDWLTFLDLGGVFVVAPKANEIDVIADKIAAQWAEKGLTLEDMLAALWEERDRRG